MKQKMSFIFLCVIFAASLAGVSDVQAEYAYLDGDLVFHGKISEQLLMRTTGKQRYDVYDYDIFNFRTTFKLETKWDAIKDSKYNLTFYSVFKDFYDAAADVDSGYRNYLQWGSNGSNHGIDEVKSYETFTDICRELYAEVTNPWWQLRVGKQIVSWGEASFERMADVVNPLDARGDLNPVLIDFDEAKRGLWMARFTLTPPDFWQDMFFEFLVIPDFEPTRNWPAGYHLTHPPSMNQTKNPNELFLPDYRTARDIGYHDPAMGFRIRGLTFGFDWTVFYLYHRSYNSVIKEGKGVASQLPVLFGRGRVSDDVKMFGHQTSTGFTFNRPVNKQITIIPGIRSLNMSGNIWRLEFLAELGKENDRGYTPNVVEKDRYAFVMGWDTYIQIPWLSTWNRNRKLSSSTQLFMEWVPGKHRDDYIYPWVTYGPTRKHAATITESLSYDFWNSRILPAIYLSHAIDDGRSFYAPTLAFKPTFHWTYLVRYINYIDYGTSTQNLDYVLFDVTYEF